MKYKIIRSKDLDVLEEEVNIILLQTKIVTSELIYDGDYYIMSIFYYDIV